MRKPKKSPKRAKSKKKEPAAPAVVDEVKSVSSKVPKKKAGRPTKYRKEYNEQVYKLCLLSATDKELADFFGTSEVTINAWKKRFPTFLKSIKRGKIKADAEVAEKLFRRACGYSHPDVHISNYQGDITVTGITKHYPPDTAAAFIWLKNRRGWKDKSVTELKVEKETATLLGLIDGSSKGKLPTKQEVKEAGK